MSESGGGSVHVIAESSFRRGRKKEREREGGNARMSGCEGGEFSDLEQCIAGHCIICFGCHLQ